jgi:predicted DNA-binding transcriptional regulator AlpA
MENHPTKQRKVRPTKLSDSAAFGSSPAEARSRLATFAPSTVFTTPEARTYIGVGVATWDRWKQLKKTPPAIRLSARRLGYRKADLDAWLDARTDKIAA